MSRTVWQEVTRGMTEMLAFTAGKTAVYENELQGGHEVVFGDLTAVRCMAEERGYRGSDVTDPDPAYVIWYVTDAYRDPMPAEVWGRMRVS